MIQLPWVSLRYVRGRPIEGYRAVRTSPTHRGLPRVSIYVASPSRATAGHYRGTYEADSSRATAVCTWPAHRWLPRVSMYVAGPSRATSGLYYGRYVADPSRATAGLYRGKYVASPAKATADLYKGEFFAFGPRSIFTWDTLILWTTRHNPSVY